MEKKISVPLSVFKAYYQDQDGKTFYCYLTSLSFPEALQYYRENYLEELIALVKINKLSTFTEDGEYIENKKPTVKNER